MSHLMIADYRLRQVLDSRGNPTVEAEIVLEDNTKASASAPSGASTGEHEAVEKRDHLQSRYCGKSVDDVIEYANERLGDEIIGHNVFDQQGLDRLLIELDGTLQKSNLGANVILPISLAAARAASKSLQMPLWKYLGGVQSNTLPVPLMNVINGGAHADNGLAIQEFMIVPVRASSFSNALRCGTEVYHHLKSILFDKGLSTNVGDEGGFAPNLANSTTALDLISEAIKAAGYVVGKDVCFALDVAASELYSEGVYHIDGQKLSPQKLIGFYDRLCANYPIVSIEDGAAENDWDTWKALTEKLGSKIQLVGDDLFVTNSLRLQQGILDKAANALLVKPNQVGTLTETIEAITMAQRNMFNTVISHRSGETEDTFIADLAVAFNAGQIKVGAPCRMDRVAKYNQLLRIEETLGENARYSSDCFRSNIQSFLTI